MKIVHVISEFCASKGGTAFALRGLVLAQKAQGLQPVVVSTSQERDNFGFSSDLAQRGVECVRIAPSWTSWRYSFHTKTALELSFQGASIVHAHGVFEHIVCCAARVSSELNIPFVLQPHGILDEHGMHERRLKKFVYMKLFGERLLRRVSVLHLTTNYEAKQLVERAQALPQVIISNGIDFPPAEVPSADFTSLRGHTPYMVFLGRIHRKKGLDILLDALPLVERKDLNLVIIGDCEDDTEIELKSQIARLDIGTRVEFVGAKYAQEKYALLAKADCLVLPSRDENFALVVAEALSLGVPVVVSDRVGLHEFVSTNRLGIVCKLDRNELASAISRLKIDDRQAFSVRARALVQEHFDWSNIVVRLESLYRSLSHKGKFV